MDKGAMDIERRRVADREARAHDSVGHMEGAGRIEESVPLIQMSIRDVALRRALAARAGNSPCDLKTELHQLRATDACLVSCSKSEVRAVDHLRDAEVIHGEEVRAYAGSSLGRVVCLPGNLPLIRRNGVDGL
jgi:hypothetical protein